MREDSPGSVLINLQFKHEGDVSRRIFKERSGMERAYTLYAYIISGFELDPKNKDSNEQYTVYAKVEMDGKSDSTPHEKSRYPFW